MGVGQSDVSRTLKGQFRDVSVERVMRTLTKPGCEIGIVAKPRRRKQAFAAIRLDPVA